MAELSPVILCLTGTAQPLADRIAAAVGGTVHGLEGRTTADVTFAGTLDHIRTLFAAGHPVIGLCAAGILIRAVAPMLSDKRAEAPVIAVAEDGSTVVPLLGGHRGANALARCIGDALDCMAAITTAGDARFGVALDEPPEGWTLANPEDAKPAMAAALAGARVLGDRPFGAIAGGTDDACPVTLVETLAPHTGDAHTLVYHPRRVVIGVGCIRDCPPEDLATLVDATLTEAGLAGGAVAALCSLDLKSDEAAMLALARSMDVPFRVFDAATLEGLTDRLATPSEVVFAEVGCHGVAEAAALAGAGTDAVLTVTKRITPSATVAIATAPEPITTLAGRAPGRVCLVGIGPGEAAWRTPEASAMVAAADDLVGYGYYIDLLGPLAAGKPRHDFPLGGEEARCRHALTLAGEGRTVALICSGDAGIFAMGALVHEVLARPGDLPDAARRVEVVTAPGVSALQAAAARSGAPLGHDFCAISLSDLLTPRPVIKQRVAAAAVGDFVIAFYNPVSKRRRDLFDEAIATLREHRPAETPVVLARLLGREDESVQIVPLHEVHADQIDMMTVVIVGSSESRRVRVSGTDRVFTPRGYAAKLSEETAA